MWAKGLTILTQNATIFLHKNNHCKKIAKIYAGKQSNLSQIVMQSSLRPVLNFAPRGKLDPQGRSCPAGVNFDH
jgi:hypothetical protein